VGPALNFTQYSFGVNIYQIKSAVYYFSGTAGFSDPGNRASGIAAGATCGYTFLSTHLSEIGISRHVPGP
jgi:hypothetical protein